jgi:transcriptional regulator with XRE-family HTH domain
MPKPRSEPQPRTWLVDRLKEIGKSRAQLARELDVTANAVDKWATGANRISLLSDLYVERIRLAHALEWDDLQLCAAAGFPAEYHTEIGDLTNHQINVIEAMSELDPLWQITIEDMVDRFKRTISSQNTLGEQSSDN